MANNHFSNSPESKQESEEWRDVPGYEGFYQVSNLGRVRSLGRYVSGVGGSRRWHEGRILNPYDAAGYKSVRLYKNGNFKDFRVHRLVLAAFVGPLPEGGEVNHKDANKGNNRLSNIEYTTRQGNMTHAVENDLMAVGEDASSAVLTADEVREIRRLYAQNKAPHNKKHPSKKYSQRKLAKMFGVGKSTIGAIIRREWWDHID